MNLQEIRNQVNSILNKDQTGNVWNEDRFNINIATCSVEFFNYLFGLMQEYKPGFPIPGISAELTQLIIDWLSPFKVNMGGLGPNDVPALQIDANGIGILPSDYAHLSVINIFDQAGVCEGERRPVSVLTDQQWDARVSIKLLNRRVRKNPYCNFQAGYFRMMPKDVGLCQFVYFRLPRTPFFDYYINANDVVVWMPPGTTYTLLPNEEYRTGATSGTFTSLSQNFEYADAVSPELINWLLSYVGKSLRSPFLTQIAEARKQTGK